jgi:MFS family permease
MLRGRCVAAILRRMMQTRPRPPVLRWYKAYVALLVAAYAAVTVFGVVLILARHSIADADTPPAAVLAAGVLAIVVSLPLFALCAAALFLPPRPWSWIYHLCVICLGMTSACCWPICIPLLIYWIKPESKQYFGRAETA